MLLTKLRGYKTNEREETRTKEKNECSGSKPRCVLSFHETEEVWEKQEAWKRFSWLDNWGQGFDAFLHNCTQLRLSFLLWLDIANAWSLATFLFVVSWEFNMICNLKFCMFSYHNNSLCIGKNVLPGLNAYAYIKLVIGLC